MKSLVIALLLAATTAIAAPVKKILVFGDSLSAGYGLAVEQSWPSLLAQKLQANGLPYHVVNASISGETTAGGLARLPAALRQDRPDIVILELGANDGLRGLSLDAMRSNLVSMIRAAKQQHARVLLVGIRLPPNYGPDYTARFARSFADIAQRQKVPLLPFLLDPIASDRNNFQDDGLHPVAAAQPALLDHVWKALAPLLKP